MNRVTRGAVGAVIALLFGVVSSAPLAAQEPEPGSEEAAVLHATLQLFEAMRTSDGELAASLFHPDARMGRATEDGIRFSPADGFIQAVGREKDEKERKRMFADVGGGVSSHGTKEQVESLLKKLRGN